MSMQQINVQQINKLYVTYCKVNVPSQIQGDETVIQTAFLKYKILICIISFRMDFKKEFQAIQYQILCAQKKLFLKNNFCCYKVVSGGCENALSNLTPNFKHLLKRCSFWGILQKSLGQLCLLFNFLAGAIVFFLVCLLQVVFRCNVVYMYYEQQLI
eukprot:TRINITY_DN21250_c0_g1_i2.p3 TRINITY_DN21250_c0_g1~~TRINITY_DN21250_c0_g1_i2.p3  ORF type:complete len:157 (+),score=0.06 TRINITY_DN21250_c0_g1_i2:1503-1973(+)